MPSADSREQADHRQAAAEEEVMNDEHGEGSGGAVLGPEESVLFIDRKKREYLHALRPGERIHLHNGWLWADEIIGCPEGTTVRTSGGERFLVLRPTFADLIPNLPRKAQVIYPKDIGPILLWGDIYPGARVVEIGTGPGAMTMALLRAVGPKGHVTSYEARADFGEMARKNVRRFHGNAENWELKLGEVTTAIDEDHVDRMIIDIAEPWTLLPVAARALRPGGVLIAYVPTALQLKQFVEQARHMEFGAIKSLETMLRFWHVKGLSVRPEHRMVGHTGFIICARHLAPGDSPVERPRHID